MGTVIQLQHEEANIRCTMVLLLAQYKAGEIPVPLSVKMAPRHLLEHAWRAAAIAHLNGQTDAKMRGSVRHAREQQMMEYNERLDWEERRERRR